MVNGLRDIEIDALGEILNISMGSAATAVSTMLDTKVDITTPKVSVLKLGDIDSGSLEPAMIVKITYVEGITGSNVMVFRQQDMQLILNRLMGMDTVPDPNFQFDELAISAACEVMNQMMGSSATALSEFLGKTINISTPEAYLMDAVHTFQDAIGLDNEEMVAATNFNLVIDDLMHSEYMSVMSLELAHTLVSPFVGTDGFIDQQPAAPAAPKAAPQQAAPQMQQQPMQQQPMQQQPMQQQPMQQQPMQQQMPPMQQQMPPMQQQMPPMQQPMMNPQAPDGGMYNNGYPQGYGYPPPGYGYPPPGYGYPPQQAMPQHQKAQPVNVQNVSLPQFNMNQQPIFSAPISSGNVDLIRNVPLGISVEIGRTKRKVKEILDFTQGTIIELEKQAGASADIIVNGQLIARGDIVVIDDNFGVRITEIINIKDLIASGEQGNEDR